MSQQTTIDLNQRNCLGLLCEFLEQAQRRGAFYLPEAATLSEAVLKLNEIKDTPFESSDSSTVKALQVSEKGIHIAQSKGAFTLQDASVLNHVLLWISANIFKGSSSSSSPPSLVVPVTPDDVKIEKGKSLLRNLE